MNAGPVPTDRRPIGYWLETILPLLHARTEGAFRGSPVDRRQWRMLTTLHRGEATLAGIRAALPPDDPQAAALPSMGERDAFGEQLADLVNHGLVADVEGRYSLTPAGVAEHDAILARISATRELVAAGIDPADFATTMRTLERIAANLGADTRPPGLMPHPRRPRD